MLLKSRSDGAPGMGSSSSVDVSEYHYTQYNLLTTSGIGLLRYTVAYYCTLHFVDMKPPSCCVHMGVPHCGHQF